MTGDHDGYTYHYDYENRLTRVKKSSDTLDVAVYTYDALGRRIAVEDCIADTTTHYYYDGWRVLTETDENDDWLRDYDYGNYIDEVLVMTDASDDHYFAHDHLFSVVALIDEDGDILERYEYDAYGKCHFYDSSFTLLGTQKSGHGNDRLFTGQVLDILDGGALSLEYFKNRYKKDGRFTTRDPLGVRDGICLIEFTPTGAPIFPRANNAKNQYLDGMSLYEYVKSRPIIIFDTYGMSGVFPWPGGNDGWSSNPPGPLERLVKICDRYKCCSICPYEQCKAEAKALWQNYYTKMRNWISDRDENMEPQHKKRHWIFGGGRYNDCDEYADATLDMGLASQCFNLVKAIDTVHGFLKGHQYVGVFHVCNESDCSDANLDPWSFADVYHSPRVKAGTCGDIWNRPIDR